MLKELGLTTLETRRIHGDNHRNTKIHRKLEVEISCPVIRTIYQMLTGQFNDKPTRGQSSLGLVNWQTSQPAKTFDLKFAVNNH